MNLERELATVRRVSNLLPINGADRIETAVVDGWQVVVKKGEFAVGDLAIYFEIDSWIPTEIAPFLTRPGHDPHNFNGVNGERLRTMKMKGTLSQGLLLPLSVAEEKSGNLLRVFEEGNDLTVLFEIQKWEKPIPAQLAGQVKGNFPSFIPKTDQPRIQNVFGKMSLVDGMWELTEKLDGSSMTVYVNGEESGVCSRSMDLRPDPDNTFWKVAFRDDLVNKLVSTGRKLALQGELIGPGIQGNSYNLTDHEFHLFDIFDIESRQYLNDVERIQICNELGIRHTPVIGRRSIRMYDAASGQTKVAFELPTLLNMADGPSVLNSKTLREGIVFKHVEDPSLSFKVISNNWLLKEKD